MNNKIIEDTIDYIKRLYINESTGHDYYHVLRVYNLANRIAKEEKADLFIVSMAALLHDIDDLKFNTANGHKAYDYLNDRIIDKDIINRITDIINNQSYKDFINGKRNLSLEGMCVQDADRLDAMGAIGIARTFAYGGSNKRVIYDPLIKPDIYKSKEDYIANKYTSFNHFYEKILKLKDLINTKKGIELANHRQEFLELYMKEFLDEWNLDK